MHAGAGIVDEHVDPTVQGEGAVEHLLHVTGDLTSAFTKSARMSLLRNESRTPTAASESRPTRTTAAPASPRARANPAPSPRVPPVTTATRPARENLSSAFMGPI